MFKVLIRLYFEPSFLELFKVFFDLKKHWISCIDVVSIVVVETLVGKFNNFLENVFGLSLRDLGLDWTENQVNWEFFGI